MHEQKIFIMRAFIEYIMLVSIILWGLISDQTTLLEGVVFGKNIKVLSHCKHFYMKISICEFPFNLNFQSRTISITLIHRTHNVAIYSWVDVRAWMYWRYSIIQTLKSLKLFQNIFHMIVRLDVECGDFLKASTRFSVTMHQPAFCLPVFRCVAFINYLRRKCWSSLINKLGHIW